MKAFPAYEFNKQHQQMMAVGGMDLRDYFAAKVLPALLFDIKSISIDLNTAAKLAYSYADAMMEARK